MTSPMKTVVEKKAREDGQESTDSFITDNEDEEEKQVFGLTKADIDEESDDVSSSEAEETDEEDLYKVASRGKNIHASLVIDPGFIDVARIEEGGSIGALALVDGKPRICTTKCLVRSHFISISKTQFLKALDEIERKKQAARVNFIKNIPLFSRLTRTYLGKLSKNFVVRTVYKDCVLYKEGDKADSVYIIKEGQFVITKRLI